MATQLQIVTKMRMGICSVIMVNMDRKLIIVHNAATGHRNRLGNDDKKPTVVHGNDGIVFRILVDGL